MIRKNSETLIEIENKQLFDKLFEFVKRSSDRKGITETQGDINIIFDLILNERDANGN